MSDFNDLRADLTRYHQSKETFVLTEDYQAILEFIQWLEDNKK